MDGAMVPIGEAALEAIEEVSSELCGRIRERFQPYEGVYRLNDCADHMSKSDWDEVWSRYPAWWPKAWMLAGNGQYAWGEVARMTVGEIEEAYDDPGFYPEYAYYTEADEEGLL